MRPPSPFTTWQAEQAARAPKKTLRPRRASPVFSSGSSSASRACCCSRSTSSRFRSGTAADAHVFRITGQRPPQRVGRKAGKSRRRTQGADKTRCDGRTARSFEGGQQVRQLERARPRPTERSIRAVDRRPAESGPALPPRHGGPAAAGPGGAGPQERELLATDSSSPRRDGAPGRQANLGGARVVRVPVVSGQCRSSAPPTARTVAIACRTTVVSIGQANAQRLRSRRAAAS